jgi:hypothetical protein
MKPLLALMRLFHAIIGITPAEPEHERTYLLLWAVAFVLILILVVACVLFLLPRIMR